MKALFINFASNNSGPDAEACFACVSDNETVAYAPIDHRLGDHQLLPALETVLQKAGWTYTDLTQIACIIGPGGFTSLRMAVSLANVLADQLQIPVAGIHLSDLYRARFDQQPLIWFHSTKKTDVFVRTFGIADTEWAEPTLVPIELLKLKTHTLIPSFTGELIPDHRDTLASRDLQPAILTPVATILPSFLQSQKYSKDLLQPWYGRGW